MIQFDLKLRLFSINRFNVGCNTVDIEREWPANREWRVKMQDWDQYRKELMGRVMELGTLSPDTLKGYQQLSSAGSKNGTLDGKTRELISLAVAVTTRCDGCIAVHADAALKQGASRAEIADALGVAIAMNTGAAMVYSARVLDAIDR
jgi:AhpD family alkylhydroperoxidase